MSLALTRGAKLLISIYILPIVVVALTLVFAFYRARKLQPDLSPDLERAHAMLKQLELERDAAMQELFRRFCDEGRLNQEKSQFQAQLAEYEKYAALTQLALGAAHEINNPLLGILSHLELELATAEGEQRVEVQQCIESARRISATLHSLMNYARPGPLVLSKVNLHRLVFDTVGFLQHQPMLHGRVLENEVPIDLPAIRVDANQLSQVLMNLLLNAAQATPEGGRITVSGRTVSAGGRIELRVCDTGSGIPTDVLPHVFEPFFTTKRGKGTGLGLSISQAYVRSHEGDIRIESVPDRGTTVIVTLPIRQAELPAEEEICDSKEVIIQ